MLSFRVSWYFNLQVVAIGGHRLCTNHNHHRCMLPASACTHNTSPAHGRMNSYCRFLQVLVNSGDFKGADGALSRLHKVSADCTVGRLLSAKMYMNEGNYEKVSWEAGRLLKNEPSNVQALLLRGEAFFHLEVGPPLSQAHSIQLVIHRCEFECGAVRLLPPNPQIALADTASIDADVCLFRTCAPLSQPRSPRKSPACTAHIIHVAP